MKTKLTMKKHRSRMKKSLQRIQSSKTKKTKTSINKTVHDYSNHIVKSIKKILKEKHHRKRTLLLSAFLDDVQHVDSSHYNHVDVLKVQFLYWVNQCAQKYPLMAKPEQSFRFATFNVHYFTDVFEKQSTFQQIMKDIHTMDVDCIGLQEVIVGQSIQINKRLKIDVSNYFKQLKQYNFSKHIFCNSVPSWYDGIYGNAILVKNHICTDTICDNIKETIHTFQKSKQSVLVSGGLQGSNETRCYIYTTYSFHQYHLHIYNTHLDVAKETERVAQMMTIIQHTKQHTHKNDVVFIMGDLNTFHRKDIRGCKKERTSNILFVDGLKDYKSNAFLKHNGAVINVLLDNDFIDCHEHETCSKKTMTTWNNTRVDFIFCNKRMNKDGYHADYFYTIHSDHIPVVLTLKNNIQFYKP